MDCHSFTGVRIETANALLAFDDVTPSRECGLKLDIKTTDRRHEVTPSRECGLKRVMLIARIGSVTPSRECGLKRTMQHELAAGHSFTGVRIETVSARWLADHRVTPSRECGLKRVLATARPSRGHSFTGVRIETS